MHLRFTDDLLLGNKIIDAQHREWFRRANLFWDAARQGKGREKMMETLIFLEDYTKEHFADEERLQEETSYPGIEAHKRQHADYLQQVKKIRLDFEVRGADYSLVIETLNSMLAWAVGHISTLDKDLADYLQAIGKTEV